jgi:hypothetical protein
MGDQSKVFKYFNEDDIWKATSKDWKWNISATTYWILLKFWTFYDQAIFYTSFKWKRPPMEPQNIKSGISQQLLIG